MKTPQSFQKAEEFQRGATQFREFLESVPVLAWRSFPDGAREFHTQHWLDYTGMTESEASGWGWLNAIHPDDIAGQSSSWESIRTSGQSGSLESRLRRADGTYRWFSARMQPYYGVDGGLESWYGCCNDIDERRTAEASLRHGERELNAIMDQIAELICVIGPNGDLLYANQHMRAYTGAELSDVISGRFRSMVFHPDELEGMAQGRLDGMSKGTPFVLNQRVKRKTGEYRWYQITYSPLRDADDRIVRWYTTAIDIHENRLASTRLQNENFALREDLTRESMLEEIVGSSEVMRNVMAHVAKVAASDSTVLILGETGTGKELIARAVHTHSNRSARAFIRVSCAAIPPSLIASELFGHEKGAFTGALHKRMGRFEAADGGTLFLDEVGDLPAETQIALLRVLQEREFERVGSNLSVSVDVRVVAATNRNLLKAVSEGTFRRDLYYRLNVFPIQLPALRDRSGDIPLLLQYFIDRFARRVGRRFSAVSEKTFKLFLSYEWPGNIRELQNVIERAVILCDADIFEVEESWLKNRGADLQSSVPLEVALATQEASLIRAALAESGGRISEAAAKLQIPRQTLASKIKTLRIERGPISAPSG
jgi:formate hydrogenlyase transcriptional activator